MLFMQQGSYEVIRCLLSPRGEAEVDKILCEVINIQAYAFRVAFRDFSAIQMLQTSKPDNTCHVSTGSGKTIIYTR